MSDHSVLRSKRTIEMISTLVRMGLDSVALGKLWKTIHRDYGIGEVSGSKLLLSPADRQALRSLLIDKANWDPVESRRVEGSRIGLASHTRVEKASNEVVGRLLALVSSPRGKVDLAGSHYMIPPGGSLALPVDLLAGIDRFVMVENLAVFLGAHFYKMPEELAGVPWVFRGSPQFSPAAAAMLAEETPNVFYFPDTDPQGLANSLNAANCSGVISCTLDELHELMDYRLDKPHDYMNQLHAMDGLLRSGHPLALVLKELRTGFSQESMAGRQLKIWCSVAAG
ncbi:hypothetical protein SAMN04490186_4096 [Pseudomonas grimontii]|uniref:DUF7281 domain-containing protein n=1 Tax=Pseudomonas grimontii TaxID=129847 RepID=A0A1H1HAA3_9PSED|nr:hypothetical protein [Pseudomonas grimontii]TWR67124.1 hypothetical protein FIV39_10500 [Pseudomonas grimontii]SDR21966.1 hypothetical protein SAMN04490186_4096 [Pseudomonas grimontii]